MNENSELTPKEIRDKTNFDIKQIYKAVDGLNRRGFLKMRREKMKVGYKSPPRKEIYVKMRETQIQRAIRLLNKNGRK